MLEINKSFHFTVEYVLIYGITMYESSHQLIVYHKYFITPLFLPYSL